jgi:hypothetical protein
MGLFMNFKNNVLNNINNYNPIALPKVNNINMNNNNNSI